jgi:hypothetical protein
MGDRILDSIATTLDRQIHDVDKAFLSPPLLEPAREATYAAQAAGAGVAI